MAKIIVSFHNQKAGLLAKLPLSAVSKSKCHNVLPQKTYWEHLFNKPQQFKWQYFLTYLPKVHFFYLTML